MKNFSLIQLYFVLATMAGLILLMISGVTLFRLGLDQIFGVKPFPEFSAPYPPTVTSDFKSTEKIEINEATQAALNSWQQEYEAWQRDMKQFNQNDQRLKREFAQALAMLLIGAPVFIVHARKVFKPI